MSSGDDARESGIAPTCSRLRNEETMRLRPAAHKEARLQTGKSLRKTSASGLGAESSSPIPGLNHTPNGLAVQQTGRKALIFPCIREDREAVPRSLDLACGAPQTRTMAHTYIRFDFGTDEEKAQQARHKLDGWRQAFRLDKRVQYKMDRPESAVVETVSKPEAAEKPAPATKSKAKPAAKATAKAEEKSSEPAEEKPEAPTNSKVWLLIRLYFSSHEKLSEQRWLERIPSEEPFKSAGPKIIHQHDPEFEATDTQFESLS